MTRAGSHSYGFFPPSIEAAFNREAQRLGSAAEPQAAAIARAENFFHKIAHCLNDRFPNPADLADLMRVGARSALGHLGQGPEAAAAEPACRASFLRSFATASHEGPKDAAWARAYAEIARELSDGLAPEQALIAFRKAPRGALLAFFNALAPSPDQALAAALAAARACDGHVAALFLGDRALLARPVSPGGPCPAAVLLDEGHDLRELLRKGAMARHLKNFDLSSEAHDARWAFNGLSNAMSRCAFFSELPAAIARWDPRRDASSSEMARLILFGAAPSKARPALAALSQACADRGAPAPALSSDLALDMIALASDDTLAARADMALGLCPEAGAEHARQLLCRFPLKDGGDDARVLSLALRCAERAFASNPASLLEDSRRLDHPAQFSADLAELVLRVAYNLHLEVGSAEAAPAERVLRLCFQAGQSASSPLPGRKRSLSGKLAASGKKHMKGWLALCESLEISSSLGAAPEREPAARPRL